MKYLHKENSEKTIIPLLIIFITRHPI